MEVWETEVGGREGGKEMKGEKKRWKREKERWREKRVGGQGGRKQDTNKYTHGEKAVIEL